MNFKQSIIGSSVAFVLATSCCWLPALIIALGGGATLLGISSGLEKASGFLIVVGICLFGYGIFQFKNRKGLKTKDGVILRSIITCPSCGHKKEEIMPTNACQYFYECEHCKTTIKPIETDCCVFCSYGTMPCPPIQLNQDCCN